MLHVVYLLCIPKAVLVGEGGVGGVRFPAFAPGFVESVSATQSDSEQTSVSRNAVVSSARQIHTWRPPPPLL